MAGQNHGKMRDKRKSPPLSIRLLPAYHDPQVRDAIEGNPKGIVSSSPGLRACELPWDIMQTASQPQRGCGRARHPRTQPRWGWSDLTRWTHGSSLLSTLGFVAESLQDSHDPSPDTSVMMSLPGRRGMGRRGNYLASSLSHLPSSSVLSVSSVVKSTC